jgi:hypothetical protein
MSTEVVHEPLRFFIPNPSYEAYIKATTRSPGMLRIPSAQDQRVSSLEANSFRYCRHLRWLEIEKSRNAEGGNDRIDA